MGQWLLLVVVSLVIHEFGHVQAAKAPLHLTLKPQCRTCGGGSSSAPGHLRPMGHQAAPLRALDELTAMPSPEQFYQDYIRQGRPVVIRGAVQTQKYFRNWSDRYMRKQFGDTPCLVEDQKKEERASGDTNRVHLSRFLSHYNSSELFMVQDVYDHMLTDVALPTMLNCDETWQGMNMVVMWMSSGGTKSVLHNDEQENLLTLVDGRKEVLVWHPTEAPNLYVHEAVRGGLSPIDQAAVDMIKFPKFAKAAFHRVWLEPGDAMYIPRKFWHQVNSVEGRNLAVNLWWFMNDRQPPFEVPHGHADHFPGFIDEDGGYGRYKDRWPAELACKRKWMQSSMQKMNIKDEEYQEGMQDYLETYRRRSKLLKNEL